MTLQIDHEYFDAKLYQLFQKKENSLTFCFPL